MEDSFYDPPADPDIYWQVTGSDGYEDFIRPDDVGGFLTSRFDDCGSGMVTAELVYREE